MRSSAQATREQTPHEPETITVSKSVLIKFIEDHIVCVDGEWGMCRPVDNLSLRRENRELFEQFGLDPFDTSDQEADKT